MGDKRDNTNKGDIMKANIFGFLMQLLVSSYYICQWLDTGEIKETQS